MEKNIVYKFYTTLLQAMFKFFYSGGNIVIIISIFFNVEIIKKLIETVCNILII